MERDSAEFGALLKMLDFNSHAHVERDNNSDIDIENLTISTHTLTWSVTQDNRRNLHGNSDFNSHAHVERDFLCIWLDIHHTKFQLTRSRGA